MVKVDGPGICGVFSIIDLPSKDRNAIENYGDGSLYTALYSWTTKTCQEIK
jgi:hypothetical protein